MNLFTRTVFLFASVLMIDASAFCQTKKSQGMSAEDMKMLQEQMKELENLPNGAELKKMVQQAQQRIEQGEKNGLTASIASEFPKADPKLLSAIPKKTMNATDLKAYISTIYKTILDKASEGERKEISKLIEKYKTPDMLHQLSIYGWYFSKAPMEAAALLTQACMLNMNDGLVLNNLAAMLTLGGAPEKAIPILQYLVSRYPEDPLVANNMGQAYAAIGVKDTAKVYLARAVKAVAKHPEANNTLAQIAKAEGNNTKAAEYAATSLEGAYTGTAMDLLDGTGLGDKYNGFSGAPELPDYFNEYKFHLPAPQMNVLDGPRATAARQSFNERLSAEKEKVSAVRNQFQKEGNNLLQAQMKSLMNDPLKAASLMNGRTFAAMTARTLPKRMAYLQNMLLDENKNSEKYKEEQNALTIQYNKKKEELAKIYHDRMKKIPCGEGNGKGCVEIDKLRKELCDKTDQLSNEYLADRATKEMNDREKKQRIYLYLFYETSRAGYLSSPNEALGKSTYYDAASQYLARLNDLNRSLTEVPACKYLATSKDTASFSANWNFKCPININLPFIIGKVNVNCESISISGGEGALFSFSQNFKTKQSTLSIGIGLDLEYKKSDGGFTGTAKVKLSQTFYITHDGKTGIYDMGMKFGAGASAGYTVPPALSKSGAMDNQSASGEVGWRFGINSGMEPSLEFNEGPFKGVFTPAAPVQVNPNVGVYPR